MGRRSACGHRRESPDAIDYPSAGKLIEEIDNEMDEFTARHFELLDRWNGHKRDRSDPEQNQAYEELKDAYSVTEAWAHAVKERRFPSGRVGIRKTPINQGQSFFAYNWARIYPEKDSPDFLAYTVGISADDGFVIKIDTVHLGEQDPVRKAYLVLRGDPDYSPIFSRLSRDEGLAKTLPELVEATVQVIDGFQPTYNDVRSALEGNRTPDGETTRANQSANVSQQQQPGVKRASLNTILYGPPGTGKTYETAGRCVEICDGKSPVGVEGIHARYGELMDEGRIEFVTFHQSYGYEEFVEGIRPVASAEEGAAMRLRVEPGVVKRIAERARRVPEMGARRIFKISLGDPESWGRGPSSDPVFAECIRDGCALLEFGGDIDWSDARYEDHRAVLKRWRQDKKADATAYDINVQAIRRFRIEMRRGDIVVAPDGYRRFRAVGEVTGDYEFRRREDGFHHRRRIKWHWHVLDGEGVPGSVFMEGRFHWPPVNLMAPSNPNGLLPYLTGIEGLAGAAPYMLVIDEINRANISKVMGELITLLEEDKREGAENEVAVTLPYSGERFTLPANLHILGTMNTADRSIALLDTALRRRFRFEEISPDPKLLHEASERTGVDLPRVLIVLNERLEYLIDRDHQIGHAWLMDVKTRDDVDAVMRYKIIPLIAEYFYDDWSKVRSVLGGADHFVRRSSLGVPPGLENDAGEARYRWTVQQQFDDDAYQHLIGSAASGEGRE